DQPDQKRKQVIGEEFFGGVFINQWTCHQSGHGSRNGKRRQACGHPFNVPAFVISDRSEEHTSELQSREKLVCRLLLEKKNWRVIRDCYKGSRQRTRTESDRGLSGIAQWRPPGLDLRQADSTTRS